VLETHVHADHLTAARHVAAGTGAAVGIGSGVTAVQQTFRPIFGAADVAPDGSQFDRLFADGERFAVGDLEVEVLHTPGHTPSCVVYAVGDALFVGDTLFMPDFGTARCDFPGGDAATLYRSIRRILERPAATCIFVAHITRRPAAIAMRGRPASAPSGRARPCPRRRDRGGVCGDAHGQGRQARHARPHPARPPGQHPRRRHAARGRRRQVYLRLPVDRI
jgi:glyoxylase-like metal-dependent hydrolase (beta-lactamase superfamily II)